VELQLVVVQDPTLAARAAQGPRPAQRTCSKLYGQNLSSGEESALSTGPNAYASERVNRGFRELLLAATCA
jgi:hypothetical protein